MHVRILNVYKCTLVCACMHLVWPATTVPRSAYGSGKGRDSLVALYITSHLTDRSDASVPNYTQ